MNASEFKADVDGVVLPPELVELLEQFEPTADVCVASVVNHVMSEAERAALVERLLAVPQEAEGREMCRESQIASSSRPGGVFSRTLVEGSAALQANASFSLFCDIFMAERAEIWKQGEYGRNREISAVEIMERFSISIEEAQLVIEALRIDGLISEKTGDSFRPSQWGPKSEDDFALRFLLETLAASRLASMHRYDVSQLWEIHDQYCRVVGRRFPDQRIVLADLDLFLHTKIMRDSGLGLAEGCVRSAMQRISATAPRPANRDDEIIDEHAHIIDAIEMGDVEQIGIAYRNHLFGFARQFGADFRLCLPDLFDSMLRVTQAQTLMAVNENLGKLFGDLARHSVFVFLSHNVVPVEFQKEAWVGNAVVGKGAANAVRNDSTLIYLRQARGEQGVQQSDSMPLLSKSELVEEINEFRHRIAKCAGLESSFVEDRVIQIYCNLMDAPFLPDFSIALFKTIGECDKLTMRKPDGWTAAHHVNVLPVGGGSAEHLNRYVFHQLDDFLKCERNARVKRVVREFWPMEMTTAQLQHGS